jgi:hypothetical protein
MLIDPSITPPVKQDARPVMLTAMQTVLMAKVESNSVVLESAKRKSSQLNC